MSGSGNIRKFSVTLSLENPLHKSAWEVFETIARGKRTEFICRKVIEQGQEKELGAVVYENTLRALKDYGGGIQKPNNVETEQAEEVEQNFFGFLSSLRKEAE